MTIFISHSSHDDAFVTRLNTELKMRGYQTWVDHLDMPAGSQWIDVIEQALTQSTVLILVASGRAMDSSIVKKEWGSFLSQDKPIFPVKIDQCVMPVLLRLYHHTDFTDEA